MRCGSVFMTITVAIIRQTSFSAGYLMKRKPRTVKLLRTSMYRGITTQIFKLWRTLDVVLSRAMGSSCGHKRFTNASVRTQKSNEHLDPATRSPTKRETWVGWLIPTSSRPGSVFTMTRVAMLLSKVSMTVTYSQRQEYPHFVGASLSLPRSRDDRLSNPPRTHAPRQNRPHTQTGPPVSATRPSLVLFSRCVPACVR